MSGSALVKEMGENRVGDGLSLFLLYFEGHSFWLYCRVVFNNGLVQLGLATEPEYKRGALQMTCVATSLFSALYVLRNPFLVTLAVAGTYVLLFALVVGDSQRWEREGEMSGRARAGLLVVYSALLSFPFLCLVREEGRRGEEV